MLATLLVALVVRLSGRGADRLSSRGTTFSLLGFGAVVGVLLECMPFSAVRGAISARTIVAGLAGVFGARLIARGVRAWAVGYRDEDRGAPRASARLIHPVLSAGIAFSGVFVMHESCASRHLALEIATTARDATTHVVHGAEPLDLRGGDDARTAVLLLHGFVGSPPDFGELPAALAGAGFDVRAPLSPGHGTTPRDLAESGPSAWFSAALAEYDSLAETHERVAVVGFSMGGLLAEHVAAARPVSALVLVNPFSGEITTPSWCPVPADTLLRALAPFVEYVMRSDAFVRVYDRSAVPKLRAYRTIPLAPAVALQEAAGVAATDGTLARIDAPTLLILSETDRAAPAETARRYLEPLRERLGAERMQVETFAASDHLIFLDRERDTVIPRVVDWLRAQGR